jgi:hypothetical protein
VCCELACCACDTCQHCCSPLLTKML